MQFDVSSQLPTLNQYLTQLYSRLNGDLTPLMAALGAYGESSTRERFSSKKSPDGPRWDDLLSSTVKAKNGRGGILVDSGDLMSSITHFASSDAVAIGTPEPYAKYHQEGTKYMAARRIFGLSALDRENMGNIVNEFLVEATNG